MFIQTGRRGGDAEPGQRGHGVAVVRQQGPGSVSGGQWKGQPHISDIWGVSLRPDHTAWGSSGRK